MLTVDDWLDLASGQENVEVLRAEVAHAQAGGELARLLHLLKDAPELHD